MNYASDSDGKRATVRLTAGEVIYGTKAGQEDWLFEGNRWCLKKERMKTKLLLPLLCVEEVMI